MSSLASTLAFVQQQFIRYVYSFYLVFGITGCCLNIILLTRQQFRIVSCCLYFIAASMAMLITLLVGSILYLYSLYYPNPYVTLVGLCKIRSYLLQVSSMIYRWCLVIASIDRYALTSTNVRLRNFAKVRVAYRILPIIIIVWFILPIHVLIGFDVILNQCVGMNLSVALYHSIFTIITGCILPFSIMITCAILTRYNLILRQERRRQLAFNQQNINESTQFKRDQQVFTMLLVQIFVYVITQSLFMFSLFYNAVTITISNKSLDRIIIERFIIFITESIVYLCPVSSFYLYTLASYTFRKELWKLLHCPSRHRQINDTIHNNNPLTTTRPIQMQNLS